MATLLERGGGMKDLNLKWLSIFGGYLAAMICNACGAGFFATLNVGVSTGFFLLNLCEYYSPNNTTEDEE